MFDTDCSQLFPVIHLDSTCELIHFAIQSAFGVSGVVFCQCWLSSKCQMFSYRVMLAVRAVVWRLPIVSKGFKSFHFAHRLGGPGFSHFSHFFSFYLIFSHFISFFLILSHLFSFYLMSCSIV